MAETNKPVNQKADKTTLAIEKPAWSNKIKEGLYWFGMLPAQEKVEWKIPSKAENPTTGEYFEYTWLDPFDLWDRKSVFHNRQDTFRIFIGKCRHFNELAVTGFGFPHLSKAISYEDGSVSSVGFPGGVKLMTAEEVERVVYSCYDHYLHYPQGLDRLYNLQRGVQCRKKSLGQKPPGMTEEEWRLYKIQRPVDVAPAFDPKKDIEIAHFVYLVPLKHDWRKWDERAYHANPNSFHAEVAPPMNEAFYIEPPKSVAEMYPLPEETE